MDLQRIFIGLAGIVVILLLALLLSTDRKAIRLRVVGAAFALQAAIAVLVLYAPWGRAALAGASGGVAALLGYAHAGVEFLFGNLANPAVGGNSFAIAALPVIIFFASLVSILYYLGIMQFVVRWIGGGLEKVTGVSKVESLCAAANIFVGQSESPLVIRPYLAGLTPAQLFTVMTSGMAGVAGTILAAYASMGISIDYLLAASFMAAPGGILMAKIIMPDRALAPEGELPLGDLPDEDRQIALAEARISGKGPAVLLPEGVAGEPMPDATHDEEKPANIIMAASQGAQTGVKIAVAVGAMVLAFVALVALANGILGGVGGLFGYPDAQLPGAARLCVPADHVPVERAVERSRHRRGVVRREDHPQRIRRLYRPRQAGGGAVAAHDRGGNLRAVRLCQHPVDRDPDRRDRQPGAQPTADDRETGRSCAAGGKPREPDVGGTGGPAHLIEEHRLLLT